MVVFNNHSKPVKEAIQFFESAPIVRVPFTEEPKKLSRPFVLPSTNHPVVEKEGKFLIKKLEMN